MKVPPLFAAIAIAFSPAVAQTLDISGRNATLSIPGLPPLVFTLHCSDEKEPELGWRPTKLDMLREKPDAGAPAEWCHTFPDGETLLVRRSLLADSTGIRDEWRAEQGAVVGHLMLTLNLDSTMFADATCEAPDLSIPLESNPEPHIRETPRTPIESLTIHGLGSKALTITFDAPVLFNVLHYPVQNGVARHELRWFYAQTADGMRLEDRALSEGSASWTIKLE